jgi:hypothetical protein
MRQAGRCVAGNIMKNITVCCLINVYSCFVTVLKMYIFSAVMHGRRRGIVMLWRVFTLPMSCYIVRKITTMSVPQSYAGYLRTSQPLVALLCYVSTEIAICSSSDLRYLRVGTTKYVLFMKNLNSGFGERRYVGWRSSRFVSSKYSRHNSSKGNVFSCGKLQKGVTFSCSRLTLEVWCIALDNKYVCMYKVCS